MGYFGDLPNISFFLLSFFPLDFREACTVFLVFFFYGLELEISGGGGEENGREEK